MMRLSRTKWTARTGSAKQFNAEQTAEITNRIATTLHNCGLEAADYHQAWADIREVSKKGVALTGM